MWPIVREDRHRLGRFRVLGIRYVSKPVSQPHVAPGQAQRLTQPHSRVAEHDQERGELLVRFLRFSENRFGLLGPEPCGLLVSATSLGPSKIDCNSRVSKNG